MIVFLAGFILGAALMFAVWVLCAVAARAEGLE